MKKYILIITGAPATGKTTLAEKVSEELNMPLFSKDKIKEILFEEINEKEDLQYYEKKMIGANSYGILYYITKQMMKTGMTFILESNFTGESSVIIQKYSNLYNYECITLKLEANRKVLHHRFLEREELPERPIGLRANGKFDNIEDFTKVMKNNEGFYLEGKEIKINTTDFSKVDYGEIIQKIKENIER